MLNLEKLNISKQVVLGLSKNKGIQNQLCKVVVCIDKSGSMANLYSRGFVQQVIDRLIPIAMAFDDNQTMEVYGFHSTQKKLVDLNINNLEGYVQTEIIDKMDYGGTNYAPALKAIYNDFLSDSDNEKTEKTGGFLGFGAKVAKVIAKYPTFVIFITDGENFDKSETQKLITEMSKNGLFIQFVGLSTAFSDRFSFLKTLDTMPGRFIDNANFFQVSDKEMLSLTDEQLYSKLLNEFPDWIKLAKQKAIIK